MLAFIVERSKSMRFDESLNKGRCKFQETSNGRQLEKILISFIVLPEVQLPDDTKQVKFSFLSWFHGDIYFQLSSRILLVALCFYSDLERPKMLHLLKVRNFYSVEK